MAPQVEQQALYPSADVRESWARFESHELPLLSPRDGAEAESTSAAAPFPLLPGRTASTRPSSARVQWRRLGGWALFFAWVSTLVCTVVAFVIWEYVLGTGCQPDGTFSPFDDVYTSWTGADVFQISLGFGRLSFTEAKVVDIAWDMVVGRGGQAVIAYVSWRVLADFVATSMERSRPVTYDTFWAVFLQQEASPVATWRLLTDGSFYRALRYKAVAVFAVLLFVLMASFPTLASAMTGYVVRPDAFKDYPNDDGNFVSFSEFDIVAYVVHDAWRINESDRALVGYSPVIGARSLRVPLMRKASGTILSNICNKWDLGSAHGCDFANSISRYVTEYGLYGLNQTPSVWRMFGAGPIQLPPPVLNVTAFYLTRLLGHDWVHPETGQRPFQDPSGVMYMHEKLQTTYSLDYLDQYGRCQPSADVYRWGFSYFQVFIMAIVLLVWTAGAWMVWLKAHINLPLDGPQYCGEAPRGWKCLLPLASTMQTQLAAADIDPTVLTEDDLRSKISRRVKRGAVSFERGTPSPTTRKPEVPLSRFLCRMAKERKWRVAIFCVYLGVACLVFVEYVALWPTPRGWVVFVVTWLASLGAYGFLFCAHMAWLLWLYLPCSSAVVVAVCLDVFGVIGDNKGLYNIWPGGN